MRARRPAVPAPAAERGRRALPGMPTPRDGWAAALVAAAVMAGGAAYVVPGVVGTFHDDAVYAVTARALAEGDGYRLVNLPGAPPQTKYPILYPGLLALVWRLAPEPLAVKLAAMQWATLGLAAAALALAYLYVVRFRYVRRLPALIAALLCASAPNVLYYASAVLTEMPFALALVAALWIVDAEVRAGAAGARRGVGRELLVGGVLAVPFLCRTVGIVLPPVALFVLARAGRRVRWCALGAAVVVGPWLAWAARGAGTVLVDPVLGYQTDYLGWWAETGAVFTPDLVAANLRRILAAVPHIAFEGTAAWAYERAALTGSAVVGLGAAVVLALVARCREGSLLPLVLAGYLALVLCWPWPPDRFVVPVLVLLLALALDHAGRLVGRVLPRQGDLLVAALVVAIGLLPNASQVRSLVDVRQAAGYPYFVPPDEPVTWASYADAFAWLRRHVDGDDVLAAGFDSMTALYVGRPTVRPFATRTRALHYGEGTAPLGTIDEAFAILRAHRPRYLFVSPLPAFAEEAPFVELVQAMAAREPAAFAVAYRGADPRFVILELRLADAGATPPP